MIWRNCVIGFSLWWASLMSIQKPPTYAHWLQHDAEDFFPSYQWREWLFRHSSSSVHSHTPSDPTLQRSGSVSCPHDHQGPVKHCFRSAAWSPRQPEHKCVREKLPVIGLKISKIEPFLPFLPFIYHQYYIISEDIGHCWKRTLDSGLDSILFLWENGKASGL